MAIKTFKDVIGNQGYRVDKKDREINQMVYELYGLTQEEIKIVEES